MEYVEYSNKLLYVLIPFAFILCVGCVLMYSFYLRNILQSVWLKKKYFSDLENERKAIANEIHDTLGAFVVPLKEMIKDGGSFEDDVQKEKWSELLQMYQTEMAFLNNEIYPEELQGSDLYESIESMGFNFSSCDCSVEVHINNREEVQDDLCIHIYRIIQESVVNSIKHSKPPFIQIIVEAIEGDLLIDLMYKSEKGFEVSDRNKGRGQSILAERLLLVNGSRKIIYEDDFITEEFQFESVIHENSNS
jgi:signal transduction histidine kinase